jgi:hypothetical protein
MALDHFGRGGGIRRVFVRPASALSIDMKPVTARHADGCIGEPEI